VKDCLRGGDEAGARRLAFRFVELYDSATEAERISMVSDEPDSTANSRFDALLAGVVEFSCARHGVVAPPWVDRPARFLETWWFVSGMRTLHANAIAHSPISFARRGVFLTEDALTYA
jgi:hypothetical protein